VSALLPCMETSAPLSATSTCASRRQGEWTSSATSRHTIGDALRHHHLCTGRGLRGVARALVPRPQQERVVLGRWRLFAAMNSPQERRRRHGLTAASAVEETRWVGRRSEDRSLLPRGIPGPSTRRLRHHDRRLTPTAAARLPSPLQGAARPLRAFAAGAARGPRVAMRWLLMQRAMGIAGYGSCEMASAIRSAASAPTPCLMRPSLPVARMCTRDVPEPAASA
jgi:hypothetical protein